MAHIGCIYMIYVTTDVTLQACFDGRYERLHRHLARWLPKLRAYIVENAIDGAAQTLDDARLSDAMSTYRETLRGAACTGAAPFVEHLSALVERNEAQVDESVEKMLSEADEPGRQYGCL